jgi:hypothetical protein
MSKWLPDWAWAGGSERLDHAALSPATVSLAPRCMSRASTGQVQFSSRVGRLSPVSPLKDRQHDGIDYMTLVASELLCIVRLLGMFPA